MIHFADKIGKDIVTVSSGEAIAAKNLKNINFGNLLLIGIEKLSIMSLILVR